MIGGGVRKRFVPWLLAGLAPLGGCGTPATEDPAPDAAPGLEAAIEAPSPEVVASHLGGTISLREVEAHLRQTEKIAQIAATELVDAYRQAAETLTVRRHVMGLLGDPIEALKTRGDYAHRHRQAVLQLYLKEHGGDVPHVSEAEARAFYDENRERFHQAAQRFSWHIFRRHQDPAAPAATEALLRDLKRRALAGESFAELARQHSHSETRVGGGRLGWISRGQVATPLEGPLFALQEGEVSEPVSVPGGAVLFHVTEVRQEKQHPFEDVRGRILELLEERRRGQLIAGAAGGLEPPAGSLVLDRQALESRLEAGDGSAAVLEIGDFRLTADDFAKRLADTTGGTATGERIAEHYEQEVQGELLYRDLTASAWAAEVGRGKAIRERLVAEGVPSIVEAWLEERMRQRVAAAGGELRAFHQDNRHLYQSPLRLELRTLSLPEGAGASEKMAEIERLRERLLAGELDFVAAAARLDTEVVDLGWLDFQQLTGLAPKIRAHVLDLDGTGYTVPFRHGERLNLTWVKDRAEPAPLSFDQAESRVRQDYYQRFQQRLYREVVGEILGKQEFRFYEESVRRALSLPDDAPPPAQGS